MTRAGRSSLVVAALVAVSVAGASGCFTLQARVPGVVRDDVTEAVVVGRLDHEVRRTYFLAGLVGPPAEDVFAEEMLRAARESGADGVANMTFEARFTPADYAFSALTCGVLSPRTYRLRGDLVQLSVPPVPGAPLLDEPAPAREEAP